MSHSVSILQSLRCRLIVSVVVIEVIMLSILVWNNISIIQTTHADRLRDTGESMIQQIANTSGNYMVAVDYASLEDYLKSVFNYKELLYIVVLDRDKNVVISMGEAFGKKHPKIDHYPSQADDGVFDIEKDIQLASLPMGKILMGFSLSIMQGAIDKSRNRGITIALIEIILTVLATVVIGLGLTRRLSVLSAAAAQVEVGNYAINVPTEADDEVGRTAAAFNRMVAEVSSRTQQFEEEQRRSRELLLENQRLIHTSLEIQEEERKHLARELHDELGQCLTAIQADAELIRDIASNDRRVVTSAEAIMNVSSRVYDVVHSMMHRLRPSILDNLGLAEALKDEIEAWKARHGETRCSFIYSDELQALDERTRITLYRIVQECLTNISRHAQARTVSVELLKVSENILLKVIDDGAGFNMKADSQVSSKGLGLMGMRERVNLLGGELVLDSAPGKGVSILITVPLC
ncbi:hypothetical protein MNBD_GAMMA11-2485 [hydrothermal vent metagenome]|uniref:Oxygen sensor histidine kinase NreB n=1 Tax=hydrothermal vent metagenome TaxID=652676 RepID=A0A3B0X9A6_9ZZZZ